MMSEARDELFALMSLRVACDALFEDAMSVYATHTEPRIGKELHDVIDACRHEIVEIAVKPVKGTRCRPGWVWDEENGRCVLGTIAMKDPRLVVLARETAGGGDAELELASPCPGGGVRDPNTGLCKRPK